MPFTCKISSVVSSEFSLKRTRDSFKAERDTLSLSFKFRSVLLDEKCEKINNIHVNYVQVWMAFSSFLYFFVFVVESTHDVILFLNEVFSLHLSSLFY